MKWYLPVLKKYAVFSGRAQRIEYWLFNLFNLIILNALAFIEGFARTIPETENSVLATLSLSTTHHLIRRAGGRWKLAQAGRDLAWSPRGLVPGRATRIRNADSGSSASADGGPGSHY